MVLSNMMELGVRSGNAFLVVIMDCSCGKWNLCGGVHKRIMYD